MGIEGSLGVDLFLYSVPKTQDKLSSNCYCIFSHDINALSTWQHARHFKEPTKVSFCQELHPFCKDLGDLSFGLSQSHVDRQLQFSLYSQIEEGMHQHFWDKFPRDYLFLAFGDCMPSFCAPVSRDTHTEHEIAGIPMRKGCPGTRRMWQDCGVQFCVYLCSPLTHQVFLGGARMTRGAFFPSSGPVGAIPHLAASSLSQALCSGATVSPWHGPKKF